MRTLVLGLVLIASAVAAEDRLDALAATINALPRSAAPVRAPLSEANVVERLARLLATEPAQLRAERVSSGLGWGDLFVAHRVATRGGHPIEKVIAARRTGARWTEIAEEATVDAEALIGDVTAGFPESLETASRGPGPAGEPRPAAAPATETEDKARRSLKDRFLDLFRGAPDEPAPPPPSDRAREEIREKMLRGGPRTP